MIPQIRPAHLASWLQEQRDQGAAPYVLDVREPHELETARIAPKGLPVQAIPMGSLPERLSTLDPAQPVACLCHHGARSMRVAVFLAAQGFEHVVNIAGGIDAWSAEVDPTVARY